MRTLTKDQCCAGIPGFSIPQKSPPSLDLLGASAPLNVAGAATGREMAKKTVGQAEERRPKAKAVPKKSTKKSARPTGAKAQEKSRPHESPPRRARPRGRSGNGRRCQTAAAIRSGAISSTEVVEAHIARMRDVNPKLNAVVVDLFGGRAPQASQKPRTMPRDKRVEPGPLHGVPITPSRKTSTMKGGLTPTGWPRR